MEDLHKLQYIKYKTKYLNLRKIQTGGGELDAVIPDINKLYNKLLYLNVLSNYEILLLKLQNFVYKIKYGKYVIINSKYLENIYRLESELIKRINNNIIQIRTRIHNREPFNEQHTNICNNLEIIIKLLITYLQNIIMKSNESIVPRNIKTDCDNVYTTYDKSLKELYVRYQDEAYIKTLENDIDTVDTFEKLMDVLKPNKSKPGGPPPEPRLVDEPYVALVKS